MDKENFILAFQIDNDKLFNGLIDYHKNNHEYKYKSEHTTHDVAVSYTHLRAHETP